MNRNHMVLIGVTALLLVVTGCAQKPVVEQGPGATVMVMTDHAAGTMTYDATPVTWNVKKNTLWSPGKAALHSECSNSYYAVPWSAGSPILAVQDWTAPWGAEDSTPVLTAMTDEVSIIKPSESMRLPVTGAAFSGQWYAPGKKAFLLAYAVASTKGGVSITLRQASATAGSSLQTLTVQAVSVPATSRIVYGSGDFDNGFVLLDVPVKPRNNVAAYDLALLRLQNGKATLVMCANPTGSNWDLVSAVDGSCARVGSLLYFTHGDGKIGCIDTAVAAPVIVVPEKINAFTDGLRTAGGKGTGPVQARLACDDGRLIIGYPDVDWSWSFYAVDAAGTVLGHLHAAGTVLTSFDAEGRQGVSLTFRKMDPSLLFPSPDLFVS